MSTEERDAAVWGVQLKRGDLPEKRILWGVFLIVAGGLLLLQRVGVLDIPSVWKLWPIALLFVGAGHVLERRAGAALAMTLLSLSFFAAEFHWGGLTYRTFWPLPMIAAGVGLVVGALTREDARCTHKEA